MGRTIKKKVELDKAVFKEKLYPRANYNWQTAYIYSESMKAGAKFPPIVLAKHRNQLVLVDGKHRLEATKLNKKNKINAIIHTGWSEKKILEEAIKLNVVNGRPLSPYEKRSLALRLRELKYGKQKISTLLCIPQEKLEAFVGQRLVSSTTGKEITGNQETKEHIVKSGNKHLAGSNFDEEEYGELEETERPWSFNKQSNLFKQVLDLLEKKLVDTDDEKVMELIEKIKKEIKKY